MSDATAFAVADEPDLPQFGQCCRSTSTRQRVGPPRVKRAVKRPPARLHPPRPPQETVIPRFVIERSIPGIGAASAADMQAISQKSCSVLRELGPQVQWVHSYVTGDKIYCIYNAASEELVREHARRGGFPADSVARVTSTIDPTTAEA